MIRLKLFSFYFLASYSLAALGYIVLHFLFVDLWGWPGVFAALPRMFMYHEAHPFSYIAVICFVYAVFATRAALWLKRRNHRRQNLLIGLVILATIIGASIPGGILWAVHDMAAGHFLTGTRLVNYLGLGAWRGLQVGWLIILLSVPYNLFGLIIAYFVTKYGFDCWEILKSKNKLISLIFFPKL